MKAVIKKKKIDKKIDESEVRKLLGLPEKRHRHVSVNHYRSVIRPVTANIYLVLAACRCGARRRELVDYRRGFGRAGRLLFAGPWKEERGD